MFTSSDWGFWFQQAEASGSDRPVSGGISKSLAGSDRAIHDPSPKAHCVNHVGGTLEIVPLAVQLLLLLYGSMNTDSRERAATGDPHHSVATSDFHSLRSNTARPAELEDTHEPIETSDRVRTRLARSKSDSMGC